MNTNEQNPDDPQEVPETPQQWADRQLTEEGELPLPLRPPSPAPSKETIAKDCAGWLVCAWERFLESRNGDQTVTVGETEKLFYPHVLRALDRAGEAKGADAPKDKYTKALEYIFGDTPEERPKSLAAEMANAFIRWSLPESVCADLCATKQGSGRIGTNLLSYVEAEAMVRAVIFPTLIPLLKERDEYRKDINGILDHCSKYITLSNDFPWAEEVHCALLTLSQEKPASVDAGTRKEHPNHPCHWWPNVTPEDATEDEIEVIYQIGGDHSKLNGMTWQQHRENMRACAKHIRSLK